MTDKKAVVILISLSLLVVAIGVLLPNQPLLRTLLILPLAAAEAVIVLKHFMHIASLQRSVQVVMVLTLIFLLSLLFWPAWDWLYSMRGIGSL